MFPRMDKNEVGPDEKLKLLQRLDQYRAWNSTRQRRLCLGCGKIISGTEILLKPTMTGLLRLQCPTEGCKAGPEDWVEPDGRV